jgi:HK97 gp10 family phage protein
MGVQIEGMSSIMANLQNSMTRNMETQMGKACAIVERSAKQKAPKDTGALRRSITSKVEVIDGVVTGVVFTPLEYAPYVEFGTGLFAEEGGRQDVPWTYQADNGDWYITSGQKPQPYLRPALKENRKKIIRILKEGVKND